MSDPLQSPEEAPVVNPLAADEPPPPYRSTGRTRRSRGHSQFSSTESTGTHSETENAPLITPPSSTRRVAVARPGAPSFASVASASPSLAHTILSIFQAEGPIELEEEELELPGGQIERPRTARRKWSRYFRPMTQQASWDALFHLVLLNFPFALAAWLYLFVFTLLGTSLLILLPIGAVLSFVNLVGARAFARGELALQARFHTHLAYPLPSPPHPIFTRTREPTPAELEAGSLNPTVGLNETSFYKNSYAMFTDPTSYRAVFYFLVIKPALTLLLSIALVVVVPVAFVLVLPAPAVVNAVRKIGRWQANIALEGLGR